MIVNGKESPSKKVSEKDFEEHKIELSQQFYKNAKEYLGKELKRYENIPVIFHE